MTHTFKLARRAARFRAFAAVSALFIAAACDNADRLAPVDADGDPVALTDEVSDAGVSADAEASELVDEGANVIAADLPGIVYGGFGKHPSYSPYNGQVRLPSPTNIMWLLNYARANGIRVLVKLGNADRYTKNSDGTFSLTKWKAQVARYKSLNLSSYIKDGTLMGHYLLDEPYDASNWGGKRISPSTVEAMAKYSKSIWPSMTTFIRAHPVYLASTGLKFTYLDAGWAQYEWAKYRPDPGPWVKAQIAAAKKATIKVIVGLNVLNGGSPESGIRGPHTKYVKWSMSASQLRNWGSTMMADSYVCGFYNWQYYDTYNSRTDIKSAMSYLKNKARYHVKTPCR